MNLFVWNACPTKAAPNTNKQPPCELLTVFCLVLKTKPDEGKSIFLSAAWTFLVRQTFIQNSFIFYFVYFILESRFRALKLKNKNKNNF
jgi:hypothetical protein